MTESGERLAEKFLREHLGALQEKSVPVTNTLNGHTMMAVDINDAKDYGQAAFEAGRGQDERRDALLQKVQIWMDCDPSFIDGDRSPVEQEIWDELSALLPAPPDSGDKDGK